MGLFHHCWRIRHDIMLSNGDLLPVLVGWGEYMKNAISQAVLFVENEGGQQGSCMLVR